MGRSGAGGKVGNRTSRPGETGKVGRRKNQGAEGEGEERIIPTQARVTRDRRPAAGGRE